MNRQLVVAGVLAALALVAGSAEAQRRTTRLPAATVPGPSISPYAGYMMFGDIIDGPLGTSLTSSSGSVFGIQGNLPLGSVISLVGNVAYSEPDLRFGVPIVGGITFGKSQVLMQVFSSAPPRASVSGQSLRSYRSAQAE
jgi:hypothetical protein